MQPTSRFVVRFGRDGIPEISARSTIEMFEVKSAAEIWVSRRRPRREL